MMMEFFNDDDDDDTQKSTQQKLKMKRWHIQRGHNFFFRQF